MVSRPAASGPRAVLLRRGCEAVTGGHHLTQRPSRTTCKCCNNSFPAVHQIGFWRIIGCMRLKHAAVGAVALLAMVVASGSALAGGRGGWGGHGGGVRVGVVVGAPACCWGGWGWRAGWGGGWGWGPGWGAWGWGPGWGPGAVAAPFPVVVGSQPAPVFVERSDIAPAPQAAPQPQQPQQSHYWYYCPASRAYYPYVRECVGGWQAVSPQPPS